MTAERQARAEALAALEPGLLRVYFSEIRGESEYWRAVLALPDRSGALLLRAEDLRKEGRWREALREVRRARRLAPRLRLARAISAKILLSQAAAGGRRGLLQGARRIKAECRRAMADARCLWAYNLLELVLCAEGRQGEAYEILEGLSRRHPDRPELLVNLALVEFGSDLESCAARLKRALALRPDWAALRAFRGELLRLRGRSAEALADLDFVVRERPDYDRAYLWRAKVRRGRGELAEALRDADLALALEPGYARAHFERFQISLELEDLPSALASLTRAENLESGYPWNGPRNEIVAGWRYRRFVLLCRLRRYEEALKCLARVRREDPKYTWSFGGRRAEPEEARRQLDEAVRLHPSNAWFLAWRGQTALASGDFPAARVDLDAALRLDPRPPWFRAWRGELNLRTDRLRECLTDLSRAVRAKDCRGKVEGLRAEADLKRGRWAAALAHGRRAARLEPSGVWALLSIARALRELGRLGRARSVLERARRLAPGDAEVLRLLAEFGMREPLFPFDIVSGDGERSALEKGYTAAELSGTRAELAAELKGELRRVSKAALARTHAKMGWVSHCLGEDSRALDSLNQAVELDPSNAVHRVWRGWVRRALGRAAQ